MSSKLCFLNFFLLIYARKIYILIHSIRNDWEYFHDNFYSEKQKEKKKKKKKKQENATDIEQATTGKSGSSKQTDEKAEAKPSKVRTFPNGLVIEMLAMGIPDGRKAAPGKKVLYPSASMRRIKS